MPKPVSKSTSEAAKKIWAEVDRAAASCPEWIRPQVEEAAMKSAERVLRIAKEDKSR